MFNNEEVHERYSTLRSYPYSLNGQFSSVNLLSLWNRLVQKLSFTVLSTLMSLNTSSSFKYYLKARDEDLHLSTELEASKNLYKSCSNVWLKTTRRPTINSKVLKVICNTSSPIFVKRKLRAKSIDPLPRPSS